MAISPSEMRAHVYSKTYVKRPLPKKTENCFKDKLSFNVGQKYCRMLQREHSAILLAFIMLLFVIIDLRSLFCLFLSGRFIQILLKMYRNESTIFILIMSRYPT